MLSLIYLFFLEMGRYKKIILENNIFCAFFLVIKKILTSIFGFCIALFIFIIRPIVKIYFVRLNSSRMGHFALSTEVMLSEFELNLEKRQKKFLFFYLRLSAANEQLLTMCKRSMRVLPFPRLCRCIDLWLGRMIGKKYKDDFVKSFEGNHAMNDVHGVFRKTKPHLSFTEKELMFGEKILRQFGLAPNDKFICLLVRDDAYMKKTFPDNNISHHEIRNVDIQNYKKAALYLAEKGYYVFRMGKHVEKSFEVNHPRIIDYARHSLRSDFMDIYLSARCYFFISTGSGLDSVSCMFRRPKLITNITLPENLSIWYPLYFFICKKIWDKKNHVYLSFDKIMKLGVQDPSGAISSSTLETYKLELIENTEDEILNAVYDMEAQLNGTLLESEEDKIAQEKFKKIFSTVRQNQNIFIKISPSFYKMGAIVFE